MAKPMTSDEIEDELLAINMGNATCAAGLRAAFTLGQDNGQAIILERASEMFTQPVADERTVQLGRSVAIIVEWVSSKRGRSFCGACPAAESGWRAEVQVADEDERQANGNMWHHATRGSDANEAISKLATWCAEETVHAAAVVFSVHDTEPPAPLEPVPATLRYLDDAL